MDESSTFYISGLGLAVWGQWLNDLAERVWLAFRALQMRILFAAVVIHLVGVVIVAILGQQGEWLLVAYRSPQGRPHHVFRPLAVVDCGQFHARAQSGSVSR